MKRAIVLLSMLSLLSTSKNKSYCDIKGNVNNPGVYEIRDNYTIQDIINEAGGLKKGANTKNINLSKKVVDEMVIYIFSDGEINRVKELKNCVCEDIYVYKECPIEETKITTTKPKTTSSITIPTSSKTTTTKVTTSKVTTTIKQSIININTCTLEELMTLNGLGEKKAQAIIDYREEFGSFVSIEDLLNVKGIGNKVLESIRPYIKV